jgi:opacity protein-like surface antigen
VRLEGELRFAAFSSEALRPGNGGAAVPLRGRVDMDSLFANAFYDIPLTDIFGLSVGGGIGAARFSPDMMDSFGDHLRSAQTGFSWQGIGGLRAKLTDQLELQADYRHQTIDSTEHSFAPAEGQSTRLSLGNKPVQSVMLSIRWFFNPLH